MPRDNAKRKKGKEIKKTISSSHKTKRTRLEDKKKLITASFENDQGSTSSPSISLTQMLTSIADLQKSYSELNANEIEKLDNEFNAEIQLIHQSAIKLIQTIENSRENRPYGDFPFSAEVMAIIISFVPSMLEKLALRRVSRNFRELVENDSSWKKILTTIPDIKQRQKEVSIHSPKKEILFLDSTHAQLINRPTPFTLFWSAMVNNFNKFTTATDDYVAKLVFYAKNGEIKILEDKLSLFEKEEKKDEIFKALICLICPFKPDKVKYIRRTGFPNYAARTEPFIHYMNYPQPVKDLIYKYAASIQSDNKDVKLIKNKPISDRLKRADYLLQWALYCEQSNEIITNCMEDCRLDLPGDYLPRPIDIAIITNNAYFLEELHRLTRPSSLSDDFDFINSTYNFALRSSRPEMARILLEQDIEDIRTNKGYLEQAIAHTLHAENEDLLLLLEEKIDNALLREIVIHLAISAVSTLTEQDHLKSLKNPTALFKFKILHVLLNDNKFKSINLDDIKAPIQKHVLGRERYLLLQTIKILPERNTELVKLLAKNLFAPSKEDKRFNLLLKAYKKGDYQSMECLINMDSTQQLKQTPGNRV